MAHGLAEIARFKIDEVDHAGGRRGHGGGAADRRLRRVFVANDYGHRKRAGLAISVVALDGEDPATEANGGRGRGTIPPGNNRRVMATDARGRIAGIRFGTARVRESRYGLIYESGIRHRAEVERGCHHSRIGYGNLESSRSGAVGIARHGNPDRIGSLLAERVTARCQRTGARGGEDRIGCAVSPIDIHRPGSGIRSRIAKRPQDDGGRKSFRGRLVARGRDGQPLAWEALRVDGDVIVIVVSGVGAIAPEPDAAVIVVPEVAAAAHVDGAVDAYLERSIRARAEPDRNRIGLILIDGRDAGRPRTAAA